MGESFTITIILAVDWRSCC